MTRETANYPEQLLSDARRVRLRAWLFPATQALAFLIALYLGWHGYRLVYDRQAAIDEAALWYAVALGLIAYFAWDGNRPHLASWPANTLDYVRAHPVELTVLGGIVALAAFIRLFRFGVMPPHDYIILEEHINAGISWDIVEYGARPFGYPLVRYSTALGIWLFGPGTTGLRFAMVAASILAVFPFYLLMREVTARPAALFATGVFASLRVFGDITNHFQVGELVAITTVWLTLRGMRSGNALWLIPASWLAAILLYEYETFKAVPFLLLPFIVFAALRAIVWPLSIDWRMLASRAVHLSKRAAKPVLVVTAVMLIAIGPMIAQRHRGEDIFFSSLERQQGDREARGTPGLFAPNADEQLKWTAQLMTPWVKPDYVVLGPIETGGVVDRITSLLIWMSLAAGALMFWRGARLLFVTWFAGGMLIAALLLANFAPWKLIGFLPPGVALIGLLADDVFRLADRLLMPHVQPALMGAAALIVLSVAFLNARTLNANAENQRVLREFSNIQSQLYSICNELRSRPDDTVAVVSQKWKVPWGFGRPQANGTEAIRYWGDFRFVCHGLEGTATADLQEAWPLYVDPERPVSLVTIGNAEQNQQAVDAVERAIPEVGAPDLRRWSPGDVFQTLIYDTDGAALNARRGLVARALDDDGQVLAEQIISSPSFSLEDLGPASAYELSGLVYLGVAGELALAPSSPAADVRIVVNGQVSYERGEVHPAPLHQGWQLAEITLPSSLPAVTFVWRSSDGPAPAVPGRDDFFALADTGVWTHVRSFEQPDVVAQRFDFSPHVASLDGLRIDAGEMLPEGTRVVEDRWRGRWTVEQGGEYRMVLAHPAGPAVLTVDGQDVVRTDGPGYQSTGAITLAPGDHTVEIVFSPGNAGYIGGTLFVTDPSGERGEIRVNPF